MRYILSLGSNIGDRLRNLKDAISRLEERSISIIGISSLYASNPVNYTEQPDFINISLDVETELAPQLLLEQTQQIEQEMGRKKVINKGPRNIDIDIILWENGEFISENLIIPHPEAANRLFVIFPTLEIIEGSGHFKRDKEIFHTLLEKGRNRYIGQKIEKLSPFSIEKDDYGWNASSVEESSNE
ncbi:2-amino-4-hydroxy-6-hydroxymethyldihydropteridine diphosphokinase [bacterium]|jgi:2-amino-4-hydroxy-6-hydroxymethyldihydropteridine diphosphokinase|nr:2-amino-4-hydroxy-6-hydroxymethyldihydropteridine diphosphokinase [bacterium]